MKIGFIGLGNMATAMIGGIIKEGIVKPGDILGSSKTEETLQKAVDALESAGWKGMLSWQGKRIFSYLR